MKLKTVIRDLNSPEPKPEPKKEALTPDDIERIKSLVRLLKSELLNPDPQKDQDKK